ncbi:tRNA (adenosine(37)-N6)-threonylcarbamoyltransferase complex dimerization subunit type 1 TsaB [Candidatus Halobeggiatoa sp. HSG11]|nr:tRNA (adenosine(37)-N6)-threonylcarbamoyltransferase complex dimerization subunit type 1 TsaB [Candidatus Halobeggiatoa sp. HSG11]
MKILAIDTSTEACSCALHIDGEIQTRSQLAPQKHTKLILPMADELLAEAGIKPNQLNGLAVGIGPGSFTGLRIACGVAQGIAFAADIPVAPISSLATLAQAAYIETGEKQVLAMIDARMEEIYYGYYIVDKQGIMQCQITEQVAKPNNIELLTTEQWYGTGSGLIYAKILKNKLGTLLQNYQTEKYPQASAMIPLALSAFQQGQVVNAENVSPIYLRGMNIK